ncbi:MAG: hypothetical protein KatS3mg109_2200 [Pirellulaceae bacterium]|nr:MAG: hypothetical protein KatS3mg109_2200 [Pirellulaceae bacterium]
MPKRIVAWLAVVLCTLLPLPLTLHAYVTPLVGVAANVALEPLHTLVGPLTVAVGGSETTTVAVPFIVLVHPAPLVAVIV